MSYKTVYGASIYLTFAGKPIILTGNFDEQGTTFQFEMKDFTLQDIINGIIQMVKPGYTVDFDAPWSYLLKAKIAKFKLSLRIPPSETKKPIEFGIEYDTAINIAGFEITSLRIFARSVRDVNFKIAGSLNFLGVKYALDDLFGEDGINLLDPQGMPKPTPKPSLFELNFLGAGQHLELTDAANYNHVKEVVDRLSALMAPPLPGTVIPAFTQALHFNNSSQWLFAIDAEIMKTVAFKIVFNDPVLYGLYLSLSGEKAKVFAGLEFEILYKKITDDIGVYQIELKLPDSIRNIELGAVSITLPIIGIWIYTNGNFKIDLGFPYNNDFSRSFTVQAFPFTGAGGFYFAVLNGSTSLTVPKTDLGSFSPVLEFGIGLNLGLGKTFNKGILSAGLTIVFYGIVEGTLGWFEPYEENKKRVEGTDLYYKLKGTFGIVGHIFGSVNFAIISATLDIIVYAQATITMEAAEPILLAFEAGVAISLKVKINLGFFSVSIHLSFSATVREQFTIGSPFAAQWKPRRSGLLMSALKIEAQNDLILNWDRLVTLAVPQKIDIYFVPFFSAHSAAKKQETVGIISLFAENNNDTPVKDYLIDATALTSTQLKTFDKLCIGILAWVFNAAENNGEQDISFGKLLEKEMSADKIAKILQTLNQSAAGSAHSPFNYEQLVNFISALFVLNITTIDPKAGEEHPVIPLTVFPVIPDLSLKTASDNTEEGTEPDPQTTDDLEESINFRTFNTINAEYLAAVQQLVAQFTSSEAEDNNAGQNTGKISIATLLFTDYFQLIAKSLLQSAQEAMEVYHYTLAASGENTLDALAKKFGIDAGSIVLANRDIPGLLDPGKKINIPGISHAIAETDSFETLQKLYDYSIKDWNEDFIRKNSNTVMFRTGTLVQIKKHDYIFLAGDTFQSVQQHIEQEWQEKLSTGDLAVFINEYKNAPVLAPFSLVTLPDFTVAIDSGSTFSAIALTYQTDLNILTEANRKEPILFSGATFTITNVHSLTIGNILNTVYQHNDFSKASGSASRFALHGLQLPQVDADGGPVKAADGEYVRAGLYELSGQQVPMPEITKADTFSYTITIGKAAGLDWLTFMDAQPSTPDMAYKLTEAEIKRVLAFQTVSFVPKISAGPAAIQLYKDQKRAFTFSNPITWSAFGKSPAPSIWTFPPSLSGISGSHPNIELKLAVQQTPGAARQVSPLPPDNYFYGTLLPVTIKKAANHSGDKINEKTFEVFGTDASGIETLTALLKAGEIADCLAQVTILYPSDPANNEARELRSDDQDQLLQLLINTNLSTESNPKTQLFAAHTAKEKISNTTPLDFISRLWKSSLVRTGGYYLYYDLGDKTLPESLFDKNGNGEIYVMISYQSLPAQQVRPYMNMACINQLVDTSQALLFGEWKTDLTHADPAALNKMLVDSQIIRNAILKPGNIGFELERADPDQRFPQLADQADYRYDLEIQYNLLNYTVRGDGQHFRKISSVTPVGPIQDDDKTKSDWHYSKAIPVSKIRTEKTLSSVYTGLGESVAIGFNWQDNYGNVFDTPVADLNYKILYFDQLSPLTSWPALTTDYLFFEPGAAGKHPEDNFVLTFHFIPGDKFSFDPLDTGTQKNVVVKQAVESLRIYAAIQDQISQQDISIHLQTAMDPDAVYPLAPSVQNLKEGILDFIEHTMIWISDFIKDPGQYNQYQANSKSYSYHYSYSTSVLPVNPMDIFALSVNLFISRSPALIDPQFIYNDNGKAVYAPGVQQVMNNIKPKASDLPAPGSTIVMDKSLGLRNFALHFEQAFGAQQFKLASTYTGEQNNALTNAQNEELWVLKIQALPVKQQGIAVAVDYQSAAYYAPQPLANFLFSLQDVEIHSFDYYAGDTTGSVQHSYNEIDAELWANNFLQSIETVLGSDMSLPINMIDHMNGSSDDKGILSALLRAKQTVADAIALQTIPILLKPDQQQAGLSLAAEKLKQQLLINLYKGYRINAVVQYPVNLASPYPNTAQPIAPNYYGKPFIKGDTADVAKNYSFSTAKIPLKNMGDAGAAQQSYLTYTFEAQSPSLSTHVTLPLDYHITHAEFNIEQLNSKGHHLPDGLNKYEISSWLNFIIPFDAAQNTVADTDIPVPLRQYPALPVFGSQHFDPNLKNAEQVSIDEAKLSSFIFDYTIDQYIAQDSYNFEVCFNTDPEQRVQLQDSRGLSAKQKALFTQLAQFEAVNPAFISYFSNTLPDVDKNTAREKLTKILTAYSGLANKVSDAWLKLYTKELRAARSAVLEVITATFEVTERAFISTDDKDTILFVLVVSNWTVLAGTKPVSYVYFPEISIDKWLPELCHEDGGVLVPLPEDQEPAQGEQLFIRFYQLIEKDEKTEKTYLLFEKGVELRTRSIRFKNLSVLLIQNAWAGLSIRRNSALTANFKTAPEFIYSTPLNRFNNPLMPSLKISNTIQLQPPATGQTQLKDYLMHLFARLLLAPGGGTAAASLKILIAYKFRTTAGSELMPFISVPVALLPPTLITDDDIKGSGLTVNSLTATILDWFAQKSPILNDGYLVFSASFYSNLTGVANSLPLLELDDLEIDVNRVSELIYPEES